MHKNIKMFKFDNQWHSTFLLSGAQLLPGVVLPYDQEGHEVLVGLVGGRYIEDNLVVVLVLVLVHQQDHLHSTQTSLVLYIYIHTLENIWMHGCMITGP